MAHYWRDGSFPPRRRFKVICAEHPDRGTSLGWFGKIGCPGCDLAHSADLDDGEKAAEAFEAKIKLSDFPDAGTWRGPSSWD